MGLIFPKLCILCHIETPEKDQSFCISCLINLPRTRHFDQKENRATKKLWGRVPLQDGASLLNFYTYSDVKWMMHRLKYEGRKDIGQKLGIMIGKRILASSNFNDIDLIIPVPLHKEKKAKRGYNQAAVIGSGISEIIEVPQREDILVKHVYTISQTTMNRIERVKNVENSFRISDKLSIQGRHILIVDDVLTTGATIEACARKLLEVSGVKISMVTACIARH